MTQGTLPKDYGMGLLKAMGLKDSLEIGKTFKANTHLPTLQTRPDRLGLGAQKLAAELNQNQKFGIKEGRRVAIKRGVHKGMEGTVVSVKGEKGQVSLSPSKFVVGVELQDLVLCQFREGAVQQASSQHQSPDQWVCQGLVVRIIDKRSKYYMLKGTVQASGSKSCWAVRLSNGKTRKFTERQLQTVIPKQGERGRVLGGEGKGRCVQVLERDMREGRVLVQTEEGVAQLGLEQVCLFE